MNDDTKVDLQNTGEACQLVGIQLCIHDHALGD